MYKNLKQVSTDCSLLNRISRIASCYVKIEDRCLFGNIGVVLGVQKKLNDISYNFTVNVQETALCWKVEEFLVSKTEASLLFG